MPRYFFDVTDQEEMAQDSCGVELPTREAALQRVRSALGRFVVGKGAGRFILKVREGPQSVATFHIALPGG